MNKVEFKYNIGDIIKYEGTFEYRTTEGVAKIVDINLKKAENTDHYFVVYKLNTLDEGEQFALEREIVAKMVQHSEPEKTLSEG